MKGLSYRIKRTYRLFRECRYREIGYRLKSQLIEEWVSYGLRRDLSIPHPIPKARIPIAIRELHESDLPHLFPVDTSSLPYEEQLEIASRRAHLLHNIPTCYVAIDLRNQIPCFAQWLMGPEHNEAIADFFDGRFPRLRSDEALLENAYTPLAYRGKGIMPAAMAMIAERASEMGRRYVLTFVSRDNTPSIKGCTMAGFRPFVVRNDTRVLFHLFKRRYFSKLPDDFILPHERRKQLSTPAAPQPVSAEPA